MRLFRQRARDDWHGAFAEIESALRELTGSARRQATMSELTRPHPPISWGELIDKITILEIKSVEIAREAGRANVIKELRLLQEIADGQAACNQISHLKRELKDVNCALWMIENAIRDKERKREFDSKFIELARSVYKRNDDRAQIKRQINSFLASEIIEEKSFEHQRSG
jgi:hypothetical protein